MNFSFLFCLEKRNYACQGMPSSGMNMKPQKGGHGDSSAQKFMKSAQIFFVEHKTANINTFAHFFAPSFCNLTFCPSNTYCFRKFWVYAATSLGDLKGTGTDEGLHRICRGQSVAMGFWVSGILLSLIKHYLLPLVHPLSERRSSVLLLLLLLLLCHAQGTPPGF